MRRRNDRLLPMPLTLEHGMGLTSSPPALPVFPGILPGTFRLMPPRDPRLCPALKRALPGDHKTGTTRVTEAPEPWSVQFGGESKRWHDVHVVAWAMDNRGREIADVEWYIDGFAWNESFIAERSKMRRRW